jgi:5'-nucleotidase
MVTLGDLMACFPYDDSLNRFTITGVQLKKIFEHIMRPENRDGEGECYQVSCGIAAVYNDSKKKLEKLTYKGVPVQDQQFYKICLQGFHFNNSAEYLNISQKELSESGEAKTVCTSAQGVLEEYLRNHQNISRKVEGRLVYTP